MKFLNFAKQIRKQLNSAHWKFSNQIKKDKNISDNYREIGYLYRAIVKRLNISHLPSEFKFYNLEAELGFLQCEVNSFPLYPLNDLAIQQNEELLTDYTFRIQRLLNTTARLEAQLNFENNTKLYKKFNAFKKALSHYAENWEKCEYNIKSAYNYNYANSLLSTSPTSTETIEKAIVYFQQASTCYAHNLRQKEKLHTDNKITETKNLLIQLQTNHLPCIQVSLPSFLMSKFKDGIIQSILIENELSSTKTNLPNYIPNTEYSKVKTIISAQPNLQSNSAKTTKRSYVQQEAKNYFFQPKKSRTSVTDQNHNFHYKVLNS